MYIVDKNKIRDNIDKINLAFSKQGICFILAYSYKTNSMSEVLSVINETGVKVCHEVVSEREYKLVKNKRKPVICNGVAMTYDQIAKHIANGDFVNFNDVETVRKVNEIVSLEKKNVGLRIGFGGSRFGVKEEDVCFAVREIESYGAQVQCLHCHVTGTRGKEKFKRKVHDMISLLIKHDLKPRMIDFGGNLYGEMSEGFASNFEDVCSFDDYALIIAEELKRLDYKPSVVLECGTAIVANAVSVRSKVIKVDEYNRVVLDCDKYVFGNVLSRKPDYKSYLQSTENAVQGSYTVYGCTCMEDDVIVKDLRCGKIIVGDVFEFFNCGAYTHCLEPEFIIERQEIVDAEYIDNLL